MNEEKTPPKRTFLSDALEHQPKRRNTIKSM
jgi:hypothetical protein